MTMYVKQARYRMREKGRERDKCTDAVELLMMDMTRSPGDLDWITRSMGDRQVETRYGKCNHGGL